MPTNRPVSCLPGVFRYGNPQNRIHVTEKPLQLMKDVIQICEPRGLILDPFVGAGTTVLAYIKWGYCQKRPKRSPYAVREDIRKLDRRIEQIEFLMKHDIITREQLAAYREAIAKSRLRNL